MKDRFGKRRPKDGSEGRNHRTFGGGDSEKRLDVGKLGGLLRHGRGRRGDFTSISRSDFVKRSGHRVDT